MIKKDVNMQKKTLKKSPAGSLRPPRACWHSEGCVVCLDAPYLCISPICNISVFFAGRVHPGSPLTPLTRRFFFKMGWFVFTVFRFFSTCFSDWFLDVFLSVWGSPDPHDSMLFMMFHALFHFYKKFDFWLKKGSKMTPKWALGAPWRAKKCTKLAEIQKKM